LEFSGSFTNFGKISYFSLTAFKRGSATALSTDGKAKAAHKSQGAGGGD